MHYLLRNQTVIYYDFAKKIYDFSLCSFPVLMETIST